jgi:hypothetical protein
LSAPAAPLPRVAAPLAATASFHRSQLAAELWPDHTPNLRTWLPLCR